MSPSEASTLLSLPADATPDQVEARFLELRQNLEGKIARAPTPGLQAKYRHTLEQVTTAFETLVLAADTSALPVIRRQAAATATMATPESPASPPPVAVVPAPEPGVAPRAGAARRVAPQKEFWLVAVVAALLLAGGGWWAWQARLGQAEKARQAEEAEQRRAEAEQERVRQEAQLVTLRAQHAETGVRLRALEEDLTTAARRLSDLRNDLRNARDLPAPQVAELQAQLEAQERFVDWLQGHLPRHPARAQLARLDAYLTAKAVADAAAVGAELAASMAAAEDELERSRAQLLATGTTLQVVTQPAGLEFTLLDAYGRTVRGRAPAEVDAPWGRARLTIQPPGPGWAPLEREVAVVREMATGLDFRFASGEVTLTSEVPQVAYELSNPHGFTARGTLPDRLATVPAGPVTAVFRRAGWPEVRREGIVEPGQPLELTAAFVGGTLDVASAPADLEFELIHALGHQASGRTPATLEGLPPGEVRLITRRPDWPPQERRVAIRSGERTTVDVAFPAARLALTSQPSGAEVHHGSRLLGTTPLAVDELPPGRRSFRVSLADHFTQNVTLELEAGRTVEHRVVLASSAPAAVHLVRPRRWSAGGILSRLNVFVDGQHLLKLPYDRHTVLSIPPGARRITVALFENPDANSKTLALELRGGEVVYLETNYLMSGGLKLERVDATSGAALLAETTVFEPEAKPAE